MELSGMSLVKAEVAQFIYLLTFQMFCNSSTILESLRLPMFS